MLQVTPHQMNQLVAEYEVHLARERHHSPSTTKRYIAVLKAFAEWLQTEHGTAEAPLEGARKQDLVRFLTSHQAVSKSTFNLETSALRSFFSWLYESEKIAANPAMRIERVRTPIHEVSPLTFDELLRLIDAVETHCTPAYRARNLAILHVLFHCALRVSELVSLNVHQVSIDRRVLADVRTKGDKRLSALMNDVVTAALEDWLPMREGFGASPDEPALFLSDRRTRLSVRSVQQFLEDYGALAGIERRVSPHVLRHSSATALSELGVPLKVIQDHCGHASITTTQRYVHASAGARRQAVDQLGKSYQSRADGRRDVQSEEPRLGAGKAQ